MKKKLNLKLSYDAPVVTAFALLSLILFVIDSFILKGSLGSSVLASPTNKNGILPFLVSSPMSYVRVMLFAFGSFDYFSLFTNLIILMTLGVAVEKYYGSILTVLCMIVTVVFTGVLNACFCSAAIKGCSCLILTMIFMNIFMDIDKRELSLSCILILILFVIKEISAISNSGVGALIISVAGGLLGSLIAFVVIPVTGKKRKGGLKSRAEAIREIDEASPRFKQKKKKSSEEENHSPDDSDDDTTVVGTLTF